jgi:hypothetical protein
MRLSVVIGTHNEGDRLWRTVGSVVENAGDLEYEPLEDAYPQMDRLLMSFWIEQNSRRSPQKHALHRKLRKMSFRVS